MTLLFLVDCGGRSVLDMGAPGGGDEGTGGSVNAGGASTSGGSGDKTSGGGAGAATFGGSGGAGGGGTFGGGTFGGAGGGGTFGGAGGSHGGAAASGTTGHGGEATGGSGGAGGVAASGGTGGEGGQVMEPESHKLLADDATEEALFGMSVSISGDTALVGAWGNNEGSDHAGSAYVFVRNGSSWAQQKLLPDGGDNADRLGYFGWSVSISGDTALVGASDSAYVFVRADSSWSQQQRLTPDDDQTPDWFDSSVSISGDTALVGASDGAYVFVRADSSWSQQQRLIPDDDQTPNWFDWSVSVDGDTALVGDPNDMDNGTGSGAAYVFVRSGSSWAEQHKLFPDDSEAGDYFGWSVSISGDTALVGAYGDDASGSQSGAAYVFVRSGSKWTQEQKLIPDDGDIQDWFGRSVSLSGDTALVGAEYDDDKGNASGSVYVFVRSGSKWTQRQKLLPNDGAKEDFFGSAVSVSGSTVLVGARQDDDDGTDSGSAYIFDLSLP